VLVPNSCSSPIGFQTLPYFWQRSLPRLPSTQTFTRAV
jgi:hypothetical protein